MSIAKRLVVAVPCAISDPTPPFTLVSTLQGDVVHTPTLPASVHVCVSIVTNLTTQRHDGKHRGRKTLRR